ncbi:MG2 domain-containing protein [Saccharicrinis sp. FJH54]|uniref:MG2 domain-containing protein n=1 Tax=Saccharicrinis sp. FJH54 TaxID=3344665 RepID=UPI0035D4397E
MLKIKNPLIPAILLIAVLCISATTEIAESNAAFIRKIMSYQAVHRQETAYLHTDKPVYYTGETIWFSGFIMNVKNQRLNETEIVCYVDLLKPGGGVVQKKILKLEQGRTSGQIDIPASYKSGEYTLVAYTNWMRNTGADFYYRKPVYILNDQPQEKKSEYAVEDTISDILKDLDIRKNKKEAAETPHYAEEKEEEPGLKLRFYPEGGDIVSGINTKVAFEAKDKTGRNIAVTGYIKDHTGNIVSTIQTLWKGRGFFMFTPEAGKTYHAEINVDNEPEVLRFPLPEGLPAGYNLKVESSPQAPNILVTITNNSGRFENLFLLAMQNTTPVYALSDSLNQETKTYAIPKRDLNTGIIQFTVFDHIKRPVCERLFFLSKNDQLLINIDNAQFQPEKRGKISVELTATDKEGYPVRGTFSLAVTDANRLSDDLYRDPDFVSNFYLSSMLPGLPADLKDILKPGSKNYLKSELLMLTNGWRRYSWKEVLKDTIPFPEYLEEPGLYLRGKLFRDNGKKKEVPAGMDVTFFIPRRFDAYSQLTDDNGEFSFILKDFKDTLGAVLQTKNKMSLKRDFLIELETNNKSRPVDFDISNPHEYSGENLSDVYNKQQIKRNDLEEELASATDNQLYLDTTDVIIDEVTVTGTKGKDIKDAMIKEFGAPEQTVGKKQLEDLNEQKPWNWGLMSMIEDAIPGMEILITSDSSVRFTPKDRRRHRYFIFVDGELVGSTDAKGMLTSMHRLYQVQDLIILDPTIVSSIDLIYPQEQQSGDALKGIAEFYEYQMSEDPSAASAIDALVNQSENLTAPVGILSIFTINGGGLYSQVHYKGILKMKITGYSKTKEFYSPDYADPTTKIKTDERTTLYWNPSFTTDEFGKATVEFYNSDIGHEFRADVAGLSVEGIPGNARIKFGSEQPLVPPVEDQKTRANENDVVFYENPEDVPVIEEEPEPVWVNPTKIKVHVMTPDKQDAVFADVTVLSRKWGNVTDEDGNFYLDLALIRDYDTVVISYKGEAEKMLIASEMGEDEPEVTLDPLTMASSTLSGNDIAQKAIRNILKTRSKKTVYALAAYREQTGWGDEMQSLLDLNIVTRTPGILDNSIVYSTRILKGQWFKTDNYDNHVDFTPKVNSIYDVQIMDPAYNSATFLKPQYRKNYNFELAGQTRFMNKAVYKVTFDQKDSSPWDLQKGFMLVEPETYKVLFVEWKASPKGARYIVPDQYLMAGTKFDDFKLLSDKNMSIFKDDADGMVLKSARQDVSFNLNHRECFYTRELMVNEHYLELPFKYFSNTLNDLDKRFVLIKKPVYNPRKWRVPWFLSVNSSIAERVPYMHEVLLLTDPDTKLDLLNIDF